MMARVLRRTDKALQPFLFVLHDTSVFLLPEYEKIQSASGANLVADLMWQVVWSVLLTRIVRSRRMQLTRPR